MTASTIRTALKKKYSDHRRYAVAEEVGLSTGAPGRRLDMMVLDCFASNEFRIDGFEIKISTSDLRRELEDPEKHIAFFDVIDYYTLAVAPGVVEPLMDIIPKKWGILIINEDGSLHYKRKPLALEDKLPNTPVPRAFLASITRAIQTRQPAEQELRDEYERGRQEGQEQAERHHRYMESRVSKEIAKLEAYDKLMHRFQLWRTDDIDRIMDEFEGFRQLDTDILKINIQGIIKKLEDFAKMLGA